MQPQERRDQLVDCARALFFERGYEATTINDIITRAGVSKGGFYHHFSSKEEILEALSVRLAEEARERVRDSLEAPGPGALQRLNAMLARMRQMKVEDAPALLATFRILFRPENIVLYYRINQAITAVMAPMFAAIIEEGRREGTFDVTDARVTAELLLHLGTATHDAIADALEAAGTDRAPQAAGALEERLRAQGIAMDRILGLPDGSVTFVEPGFADAALMLSR